MSSQYPNNQQFNNNQPTHQHSQQQQSQHKNKSHSRHQSNEISLDQTFGSDSYQSPLLQSSDQYSQQSLLNQQQQRLLSSSTPNYQQSNHQQRHQQSQQYQSQSNNRTVPQSQQHYQQHQSNPMSNQSNPSTKPVPSSQYARLFHEEQQQQQQQQQQRNQKYKNQSNQPIPQQQSNQYQHTQKLPTPTPIYSTPQHQQHSFQQQLPIPTPHSSTQHPHNSSFSSSTSLTQPSSKPSSTHIHQNLDPDLFRDDDDDDLDKNKVLNDHPPLPSYTSIFGANYTPDDTESQGNNNNNQQHPQSQQQQLHLSSSSVLYTSSNYIPLTLAQMPDDIGQLKILADEKVIQYQQYEATHPLSNFCKHFINPVLKEGCTDQLCKYNHDEGAKRRKKEIMDLKNKMNQIKVKNEQSQLQMKVTIPIIDLDDDAPLNIEHAYTLQLLIELGQLLHLQSIHLCPDYIKGYCIANFQCVKFHDKLLQDMSKKLYQSKKYLQLSLTEPIIYKSSPDTINYHLEQYKIKIKVIFNNEPERFCQHYLRGKCVHGNDCQLIHHKDLKNVYDAVNIKKEKYRQQIITSRLQHEEQLLLLARSQQQSLLHSQSSSLSLLSSSTATTMTTNPNSIQSSTTNTHSTSHSQSQQQEQEQQQQGPSTIPSQQQPQQQQQIPNNQQQQLSNTQQSTLITQSITPSRSYIDTTFFPSTESNENSPLFTSNISHPSPPPLTANNIPPTVTIPTPSTPTTTTTITPSTTTTTTTSSSTTPTTKTTSPQQQTSPSSQSPTTTTSTSTSTTTTSTIPQDLSQLHAQLIEYRTKWSLHHNELTKSTHTIQYCSLHNHGVCPYGSYTNINSIPTPSTIEKCFNIPLLPTTILTTYPYLHPDLAQNQLLLSTYQFTPPTITTLSTYFKSTYNYTQQTCPYQHDDTIIHELYLYLLTKYRYILTDRIHHAYSHSISFSSLSTSTTTTTTTQQSQLLSPQQIQQQIITLIFSLPNDILVSIYNNMTQNDWITIWTLTTELPTTKTRLLEMIATHVPNKYQNFGNNIPYVPLIQTNIHTPSILKPATIISKQELILLLKRLPLPSHFRDIIQSQQHNHHAIQQQQYSIHSIPQTTLNKIISNPILLLQLLPHFPQIFTDVDFWKNILINIIKIIRKREVVESTMDLTPPTQITHFPQYLDMQPLHLQQDEINIYPFHTKATIIIQTPLSDITISSHGIGWNKDASIEMASFLMILHFTDMYLQAITKAYNVIVDF